MKYNLRNTLSSIPVSIKFALAAMLILLVQNTILLTLQAQRAHEEAHDRTDQNIALSLSKMQLTLEFLLNRNESAQLQQEVTSLGSNPDIKSAYLVDHNNQVIASIHVSALGKDINSLISTDEMAFLNTHLNNSFKTLKSHIIHNENNMKFYAITPVQTGGVVNQSLGIQKYAYLYIVLDSNGIHQTMMESLLNNVAPVSILMVLCFSLLIAIFYYLVTSRLGKLTHAARQYARTSVFDMPSIHGKDEISDLKMTFSQLVTDLIQKNDSLQLNEMRLKKSQQLARVGSWEYDLISNQLSWSEETYHLFGQEPKTFQPTYASFTQLVHPDDRHKVDMAYASSVENNQPGYEVEHRIVRADNNEIRYVLEKCDHLRDASGKIVRSIGMVHDITEQVTAGAYLRKSEARFRSIIDASPVPMALNDDQRNITYLNPAFTVIFGYDMDDIPTLADWWPKAYPDVNYRNWVTKTWQEHLETSLASNLPFEPLELTICCKNGTNKIVLAEASALAGTEEDQHLVILYDISDIRQAQTELNKSTALLENVVNTTPDFIFVKDTGLRTILCNDAYARAIGKSRTSLYGKTDIENGWDPELVNGNPEKNIRGFRNDDLEVLSGKKLHNPYDPANVNGKIRIFDTIKTPLRDSANNIIGVLGIAHDVTDRYAAIEALLNSEQRLRLATETAGIGIWEWNIANNTIRWDRQMFRIYGLEPTSDGMIHYSDWSNAVLPADLPQQELILQNTVATKGHSNRNFRIHRRNDNSCRFIQAAETVRLNQSGDIEFVIGINRDITEARLAEDKLKSQKQEQQFILNSMIDAVITINELGIILSYNTAAEVMFGFMAEEVIGKNVKILMPADTASHHDGYLQQYIHTNHIRVLGQGREVIARRKTGETFPMRLAVADLPGSEGALRQFVGTCTDLTTIKQHEEQLRRSQKMDALGKLTGGIAHDFNNMLGVIMGYSELLQATLSNDPKQAKYVSEIFHAGERARKLTSKLLAFSRKSTAQTDLVDINKLLLDEQHLLEKTLTARINLVLNLTPGIWPVMIDKSSLEDAILNISINAMHAMPEGGNFLITSHNTQVHEADTSGLNLPAGDYVLLTLTDNGIGMDEETRMKIFDPFFTTKGENGTGLGMSQVYGFMQQSKGSITVHSALGRGTSLSLYFPRYIVTNIAEASPTPKPVHSHNGAGNILVVDDEPSLVSLAREILTSAGYQVFTAMRADQALDILQQQKIDLLFSDIVMPGMDGYALAEKVNQQYPHIHIQLVSGFTADSAPDKYRAWHEKRLQKPYTPATLLQTVHAVMRASS